MPKFLGFGKTPVKTPVKTPAKTSTTAATATTTTAATAVQPSATTITAAQQPPPGKAGWFRDANGKLRWGNVALAAGGAAAIGAIAVSPTTRDKAENAGKSLTETLLAPVKGIFEGLGGPLMYIVGFLCLLSCCASSGLAAYLFIQNKATD